MLTRGKQREVVIPGRTRTRTLVTYSIPEAAEAIGRSEPTFRRWLSSHLVPPPILTDAVRHVACYSMDELDIIRQELFTHERNFTAFCESHTETIIRIAQRMHGHRDVEFGQGNGRTR